MSAQDHRITYFGTTNHRNAGVRFGIRNKDRRSHFYIVGKTGTGKSFLFRNMIAQDIRAGEGCALFDPHGDLVASVRAFVPPEREKDLVYLDLSDPELRWRFNPLAGSRLQHLKSLGRRLHQVPPTNSDQRHKSFRTLRNEQQYQVIAVARASLHRRLWRNSSSLLKAYRLQPRNRRNARAYCSKN